MSTKHYELVPVTRVGNLREFGAALRRRREHLKLTLDALAALTGISKPYLSNIETARAPGPPSEEKLDRLSEALGLEERSLRESADWLRTPATVRAMLEKLERGGVKRRADGAIDLDALVGTSLEARTAKRETRNDAGGGAEAGVIPVRAVPLINKVAAGRPGEYSDLEYPVSVADKYIPAPDVPTDAEGATRGAFAVRVAGDSMAPEYMEGEMVVVGGGGAKDGDDCLVRLGARENFATTLKRIYFEKEAEQVARLRLVPLNPAHAIWKVRAEEVTGVYPVIYKVVAVRRGNEQ